MNTTASRTFWLSMLCAAFGMFLIYSYTQEKSAELQKKYGTNKTVLVAARDILEMSSIDETMLAQEERPVDFIQPGAVESPDDVVGLVAATPIKKGEQIILTKLLNPGASTGLAMQVAPDKRAVTIPVDDVRGVSKLIRPGDRVDLITSISYSNGKDDQREVKTVLQDVLVLATGVNVTNNIPRALQLEGFNGKASFRNLNGDTSFSTVTLEVSPQEAQNIIYIMSVAPGSIFLSLRNGNDRTTPRLATSTIDTVLGAESAKTLQRKLAQAQAEAAAANAAASRVQQQKPQQQRGFIEIRGSDQKF